MKIEVNLNENDIVKEIKDNYSDDISLIMRIIEETTTSWGSVRIVARKILNILEREQEMYDVVEPYTNQQA